MRNHHRKDDTGYHPLGSDRLLASIGSTPGAGALFVRDRHERRSLRRRADQSHVRRERARLHSSDISPVEDFMARLLRFDVAAPRTPRD